MAALRTPFDPPAVCFAVETFAAEVIGHKLFTINLFGRPGSSNHWCAALSDAVKKLITELRISAQ